MMSVILRDEFGMGDVITLFNQYSVETVVFCIFSSAVSLFIVVTLHAYIFVLCHALHSGVSSCSEDV